MEFTKEQLHVIERTFDLLAGEHMRHSANKIECIGKYSKEYVEKVISEDIKTFDMYRSISAVCEKIRSEENQNG